MPVRLVNVPGQLSLTGEFESTLTLRPTGEGGVDLLTHGILGDRFEHLAPHTLDALRDWLCEWRGLPAGGGER
ncbi:hypothetical protein K7W42_20390 [Deinococcus sp. HMF7604]|uniref:hypothetical protein n=1 Tax=Deinococcus betulae TaxID=2873312 RepID=UPI001CD002E5|nr:hypothetical protein [Deinococcus betulae]MBZ9753199.1 hypothetical protein [Deinococcus betulae]